MRKCVYLLVVLLFSQSPLFGQWTVDSIWDNYGKRWIYGLWNQRSNTWVVEPYYEDAENLGFSRGGFYVAFRKGANWSVFDEIGRVCLPFEFEEIHRYVNNELFAVKYNGNWGIKDVKNIWIFEPKYRDVHIADDGVTCYNWGEGGREYTSMEEVDKIRKQKREQVLRERQRLRDEAKEQEKKQQKEKELREYKEFYRSNFHSQQNAFNQWQTRGEFEKTEDYLRRVTGPARVEKIEESLREIKKDYLNEHYSLYKDGASRFNIGTYDADSETFVLTSPYLGSINLRVPLSEAQEFKKNFDSLETLSVSLDVNDSTVFCKNIVLRDGVSGKEYTYDSPEQEKARPNPENIPSNIFIPVNVKLGRPASGNILFVNIQNYSIKDNIIVIKGQVYSKGEKVSYYAWVNDNPAEPQVESRFKPKADLEEFKMVINPGFEKPKRIIISVANENGTLTEPIIFR